MQDSQKSRPELRHVRWKQGEGCRGAAVSSRMRIFVDRRCWRMKMMLRAPRGQRIRRGAWLYHRLRVITRAQAELELRLGRKVL
jgi:hypothetical protein